MGFAALLPYMQGSLGGGGGDEAKSACSFFFIFISFGKEKSGLCLHYYCLYLWPTSRLAIWLDGWMDGWMGRAGIHWATLGWRGQKKKKI